MDLVAKESRGGVRGGRGDFSWSDIRAKGETEKSHYIGHSIKAATGREAKTQFWYAQNASALDARSVPADEVQSVKAHEDSLMNQALGISSNRSNNNETRAPMFQQAPQKHELADHEVKGMLARGSSAPVDQDASERVLHGRGIGYRSTSGAASSASHTQLVKQGELVGSDVPPSHKKEHQHAPTNLPAGVAQQDQQNQQQGGEAQYAVSKRDIDDVHSLKRKRRRHHGKRKHKRRSSHSSHDDAAPAAPPTQKKEEVQNAHKASLGNRGARERKHARKTSRSKSHSSSDGGRKRARK